jgi:hypothetical protein
MERMAAVLDAEVVFSSLLELLASWLEDLGGLAGRVSRCLVLFAYIALTFAGRNLPIPPTPATAQ